MTDARCNRCDYRGDDLAEHAADSGHYLCVCCQRRSLRAFEAQTCEKCAGKVRDHLADIVEAYRLLEPDARYDGIPAVDALTLAGDGTMQRLPHPYELTTWHRPAGEQVRDEWPTDPLPVIPLLASWADMLREHYRDPIPDQLASLDCDGGYLAAALSPRGRDAAQTFPAFDELAADLRRLRSALTHRAGLADDPVAAQAPCFDCGGRLLRAYRPPVTTTHDRRRGLEVEGLADVWVCEDCDRQYKPAAYLLALRQHHDVSQAPEWRTPTVAAWLVDRPFRTVQAWLGAVVPVACRLTDRRLVAYMPDVVAASREASRQDRRTA